MFDSSLAKAGRIKEAAKIGPPSYGAPGVLLSALHAISVRKKPTRAQRCSRNVLGQMQARRIFRNPW